MKASLTPNQDQRRKVSWCGLLCGNTNMVPQWGYKAGPGEMNGCEQKMRFPHLVIWDNFQLLDTWIESYLNALAPEGKIAHWVWAWLAKAPIPCPWVQEKVNKGGHSCAMDSKASLHGWASPHLPVAVSRMLVFPLPRKAAFASRIFLEKKQASVDAGLPSSTTHCWQKLLHYLSTMNTCVQVYLFGQ